MKNRMFHWRKEVAKTNKRDCRYVTNSTVSGYPPIIHRWQITGSSLELHSLSILDPWVGRGHGSSLLMAIRCWDLRAQPLALTPSSPTGKHRLFFLFLALLFPSLCGCSTYNPFSLPRFLLSSCGDGPRNLTGTPPLEEPSSTAALVGSIILWIAARDRIARVSFGRLGWFLILGRGGIWKAESGAAAAVATVFLVNLCSWWVRVLILGTARLICSGFRA